MRIIGQSTIASGTPYLHLGYISASPSEIVKKADPTLFFAGVTALIVGLGLGIYVTRTKAGSTSIIRRAAFFGGSMALAVAGAISVVLSFVHGTPYDIRAEATTRFVARQIMEHIATCEQEGKPIPQDIRQVKSLFQMETTDGWFHEMRLAKAEKVSGKPVYFITSAGPDGSFDTSDDITASSVTERK